MIRKLILSVGVATLSLTLSLPFVASTNVDAAIVQTEEDVELCSNYVWMYKEVDGKKYMRLWDCMYSRWVTDWILVE